MKTMFMTGGWGKLIVPIKVIRTTHASVFLESSDGKPVREARMSEYHQWHETWKESKKFLINKAAEKVESLQRRLGAAESSLRTIEQLPEEGE